MNDINNKIYELINNLELNYFQGSILIYLITEDMENVKYFCNLGDNIDKQNNYGKLPQYISTYINLFIKNNNYNDIIKTFLILLSMKKYTEIFNSIDIIIENFKVQNNKI